MNLPMTIEGETDFEDGERFFHVWCTERHCGWDRTFSTLLEAEDAASSHECMEVD